VACRAKRWSISVSDFFQFRPRKGVLKGIEGIEEPVECPTNVCQDLMSQNPERGKSEILRVEKGIASPQLSFAKVQSIRISA